MTTLAEHLAATQRSDPLSKTVPRTWLSGYRGHAELLEACAALVEAGARERVLGRSVDGRPLFALELGAPDAPRVSVILAGTHAMEWIGVEMGLAVARDLLDSNLQERRVLYVPVLNPDGYTDVEADLRAGRRRLRRTNRNGVDLNRNWPTHFRSFHLPGVLMPWLGRAGDRARSEPEVDAVCATLHDEVHGGAAIDRALSLHSIGRMLLYPYGGAWRRPTQLRGYRAAARTINHRMKGRYLAGQCSRWIPGAFAHGMEIDHLHAAFGALALLAECSWGGTGLLSPASWFTPFRWYNPARPGVEIGRVAPALSAFLSGR